MCANCKELSNYLFPFENMSDDEFTVEFRTASTNDNATFDATQLNNLFYSGTADDDDDDVFVGLSSNNKREPYLESNQTTLLSYDGSLKNTLSMLCVNIRSLINPLNFSILASLLASLKLQPDIIAITKTWIQPVFTQNVCNTLKGYTLISNSRKTCKGGGVGFFIKKNIVFTVCSKRTIMREKIIESFFVSFEIAGKNADCGVMYRSPSNKCESNESFLIHLNECLRKTDPKQSCFVMGDFNHDLLACEPTDSYKNQFVDTMLKNSFISLINHPTRNTDTSASALDQIWTNANFSADIKSAIISDPISGHLSIIACVSTGTPKL